MSQHITCSCKYYSFTGIICQHIFRVATQLNLDDLPRYLYLTRWCKDPDDTTLAQRFREFYNVSNNIISTKNSFTIIEEDYCYLLKRTLDRLQMYIKAKPENAKYFYYEIISVQLDEKILLDNNQNNQNKNNESVIKIQEILNQKEDHQKTEFHRH